MHNKSKKIIPGLWLFIIFLFLYLPIVILTVYAFTDASMIGQKGSFSLENFKTLFTTPELIDMIRGTLVLAFVVGALSTILGTLGAMGTFYSGRKFKMAMDLMNQVPVINADVVTGFSVCVLLVVLLRIPKDTYIPLVIGQMVLCTPFVYLSVAPSMKQMDPNIYDAAIDLGCTPMQAIRKVILRELAPAIGSGFFTAVTLSMDDYFITSYTKPATFNTISTFTVNATKGSQTQIKTALWALAAVILFIAVIGVVITGRRRKDEEKDQQD